ncbi:MAG TPA: fumarylacetoacetate hydrolase family protein [Acidimicrobiia bacterium]|nr:fumarylacetoacetate hydrolase family protein [Acidimicrobiia bacterium]
MSDLVGRIVNAIRTRTPLDPAQSGLTPEAAYELQDQVIAALGGTVEAAKIGLTSKAKQQQMNVSEPSYGWLLAGSRLQPGEALVVSELIQPRVEPEIAFLTQKTLSGSATVAQVLEATAAVMPAIDVLDSRYAGYQFTLPDVIADNASAARFKVGDPISPQGIDLRTVGCVFGKNGVVVATAAGAAVLDHPAAAVAWLVHKLAERGKELPGGSLVLAGALTAAVPIAPGDVVTVEIDRVGSVHLAAT